jgi:hypothetical protein
MNVSITMRAGGVAQEVVPARNSEALNSNPNITKKREKYYNETPLYS